MTDDMLNKPKKERVWVIPATFNKYGMGKKELGALRRDYENQIGELEAIIEDNKRAGMTSMSVCAINKVNELAFQVKMIDKLLSGE